MVSKYCPKCGEELEVRHKCPHCKYVGPALLGKNNATLREVKKMEEEMSHQQRLLVAQEELMIAEDLLSKLEPLREEYNGEIEYVRKSIRDIMFKLHRIKEISVKVDALKDGVSIELWEDILADKFPSSEQVVLDYTRKGWEHRILAYLAGEL